MALKIEELQLLISANADQFKGELISVKDELRKLNKTTKQATDGFGGNLFGSIMKANIATGAFLGTIQQVTGKLGGLVKNIMSGGSQLARLRIATSAVTANLGMTTAEVQGLREALYDANTMGIAAEQIISKLALSGLIDLAEGLSFVDARSGETKHGVTALALAIKDLSAARGIDSDLGLKRVSDFIQSGNREIVNGLVEIQNITKAYDAYAKEVGKANGAALTATEQAHVRMNIVMQESAKSFGAYAATYNSSGKIFSSVRMLLANIAQEIGSNLEPVMRVGALGILEFFRGIQEAVYGSAGSIKNAANRIAGYMVALIRIIGRLGSSLPFVGAGFKRLAEFTLQPIKALGSMSNAAGGAGSSLDGAGKSMDSTGKKAKKLAKDLAGLAGFDEMNVLKEPTDSGSGGAGDLGDMGGIGGGIGDIGGGGLAGIEDTTQEIMGFAAEAEANIRKIFQPVIDFLKPFGGILKTIAKYAGLFWLAMKVGLPILKLILSPFIKLFGFIKNFIGILGLAKTAIAGLATALGLPAAPIIAIIAAIAALVAIFVTLYNTNEQFRESIDALVNGAFLWIQENLVPVFEEIIAKIQEMAAIFVAKLPEIQAALQPLIDAIATFFVGALQLAGKIVDWLWKTILKPLVDFILANIVPAFSLAIDVLIVVISVFSQVAATIIGLIVPVLNVLWTIFTTVFEAVAEIVKWAWNKIIKPVFTAIWDVITKLIIPVATALWRFFQIAWNAIATIVQNAWNGIWNAIKPVVEWIRDKIMPVIDNIKKGFEKAWEGIKTGVEAAWDGIINNIKRAINGFIDIINGFVDGINKILDGVDDVSSIVGVNVDFRVGKIPHLASGGLIKKPTMAVMGEGGYNEAVLPLDRNTEWAAQVAELLNAQSGGGEGTTVVVQIGDEIIFEKFVEYSNDRAVTTNKAILNI